MKEEELNNQMDQLLESLWHGSPLLGDREFKYDGHRKKCGECFQGKTLKYRRVELTSDAETFE